MSIRDYISIHMPHTWHDDVHDIQPYDMDISIHMPHTWHDETDLYEVTAHRDFNPHATYVA